MASGRSPGGNESVICKSQKMFLSADDLKLSYGVDMEIGRTYVDRKVPEGNRYWQKRHLYIPPVTGYFFMPIFSDLAYRSGIPLSELLSERYLSLAERILDSAGRLEGREIDWDTHVAECIGAASADIRNPGFLQDLRHYFSGQRALASIPLGTPYPSLNRADTYLFSLCTIPFNDDVKARVVEAWYALMTYFLILDDLVDIRDDFRDKEENAVIEAGLTAQGAQIIERMIKESHDSMERINPVMANRIDHKRQIIDVATIIQSFLNGK